MENGATRYDPGDESIRRLLNSDDPYLQGVGLRLAAGEYGAATGRPRRVGWTDAVAARYAGMVNGISRIILTKPDACAGLDRFRVCYGYEMEGTVRTSFPRDADTLKKVRPQYRDYEGYGDIGSIRAYEDLPESLRTAISDFEEFTDSSVVIVSVGPEAEETIIK